MSNTYTIATTEDNKKVLTITCSSKDPSSCFTEFSKEHPELRVTKIIGTQSHYSSNDSYAYSFELSDDSGNMHHQHLYWGNCRTSENPEPIFKNLKKVFILFYHIKCKFRELENQKMA